MRTRIAHTIEVFEAARKPLFTVLDGISREDLDWQPADGMRGIGKICRHMYRVDVWFLKQLGITPGIHEDAPGPAEEIAARMRTIQEQIIAEVHACESDADLVAERTSPDGERTLRLGATVLHIAQHYLYHLAQITYLRRIRDREWSAPLDEWETATHIIEDRILE
ncbi:DinB family protein [Candidatus Palauibacter soopunensis]|uniref:DinB family protein n=1 Tax=Candidatus Palauibacter soopunensis TaxID=3056739 RepID=UPI002383436A|nr:DinB family protein [Candidatus Palauibacter soopunensis]MDE2879898.1 DinB family protein [Candidatus Palauibacter soopunensis]